MICLSPIPGSCRDLLNLLMRHNCNSAVGIAAPVPIGACAKEWIANLTTDGDYNCLVKRVNANRFRVVRRNVLDYSTFPRRVWHRYLPVKFCRTWLSCAGEQNRAACQASLS